MLVGSTNQVCFKSVHCTCILVGVGRLHEYNRRLGKKSQLLLECADRTANIRRPASDFESRKESNFPVCAVLYMLW